MPFVRLCTLITLNNFHLKMKINPLLTFAVATAICAPSILLTPVEAQQVEEEYTLFVVMTSHEVEINSIGALAAKPEPANNAVNQQEPVINQNEILASMKINAGDVDNIRYEKRLELMTKLTPPMAESESLAVQAIPMLSLKGCRRAGEALKLAYTKPSAMLKTSYICIQNF